MTGINTHDLEDKPSVDERLDRILREQTQHMNKALLSGRDRLTPAAEKKIQSAFESIIYGLHDLYRAVRDIGDNFSANVVHEQMYPGVFHGIRAIRCHHNMPHWSRVNPNEDASAKPPSGDAESNPR